MKVTWYVLGAGVALLLAGCATLSEDACRGGDWERIGFVDGSDGYDRTRLAAHAKACRDYGISPDVAAWEAGRQQGLLVYCRTGRAYDEGADGRRLRDVCPVEDLAALELANERGLSWYRIGRDIDRAERRISEINALLAKLPADDPARAALTAERVALRLEILTLRAERMHYRG